MASSITNNLSFNPSAARIKGGKYSAIKFVNYDGTNISGETFNDFPYREKHTNTYKVPSEDKIGEDGNVINSEEGTVKAEVKFTIAQTDSKTITFFKDDVVNRYISLFMETGDDITSGSSTLTQYWFFPVGRFEVGWDGLNYPGRSLEVTYKPLANPSAISLSAASITAGSTSAWAPAGVTFTCGINKYFSVTGV